MDIRIITVMRVNRDGDEVQIFDNKTMQWIPVDGALTEIRVPVAKPLCDQCNAELSNEPGGGAFSSHAVCHDCWPRMTELAQKYDEQDYLRPCPPDIGLADWIRQEYW